ncbi:MAG: YlxR family protein [Acidimicrobiaceae bacterium]|nr:YlxR family protein [Acidimicrobiaceae bacterium]
MIPERTCIGCRTKRSANEMVRVCQSDGQLRISADSKGRGTWICRDKSCFKDAMTKGKLERALRVKSLPDGQKQLSSICEVLGF